METGRRALIRFNAPPVLVLMGVAGSGKSTLAEALHRRLGWDVVEGDDLQPSANVAKMAAGHPLDDTDRAPWLQRVRDRIDDAVAAHKPQIVTCSALKRSYRDALRNPQVVFVYLHGDRDLLLERLRARKGHFMPPALLDSQLADLETPGPDEQAISVDVAQPAAAQADDVLAAISALIE